MKLPSKLKLDVVRLASYKPLIHWLDPIQQTAAFLLTLVQAGQSRQPTSVLVTLVLEVSCRVRNG